MASINDLPPEIRAQIPQLAQAGVVDIQQAPGGGWYALGADGGVFAIGGARFRGGLGGTQHLSGIGSKAARLEIDPETGGYTIVGDKGHRYAFDTEYLTPEQAANREELKKPNPLYSDPDFLAFVRASDYGIETAAADTIRKQEAINRGLVTSLAQLSDTAHQNKRGIDNSFEARGVYRSGKRVERQDEYEGTRALQEYGIRDQAQTQIQNSAADLAGLVASNQQKSAELGYGTAGNQALTQGYEAVQKKYPQLFPIATGNPTSPTG